MRYPILILMTVLFMLIGSTSQNSTTVRAEWETGETFVVDGLTLYGKEGRVGFQPHGNSDISVGGHFTIYFWGKAEEIANTYKLVGTYKETGFKKTLYPDWEVSHISKLAGAIAQSGAKFSLNPEGDKTGKWRFDLYMGDNFFDSFVVVAT